MTEQPVSGFLVFLAVHHGPYRFPPVFPPPTVFHGLPDGAAVATSNGSNLFLLSTLHVAAWLAVCQFACFACHPQWPASASALLPPPPPPPPCSPPVPETHSGGGFGLCPTKVEVHVRSHVSLLTKTMSRAQTPPSRHFRLPFLHFWARSSSVRTAG